MGWDCSKCGIRVEHGSSNANECAVNMFVCLSDAIHTTTVRTTVRNAPACEEYELYVVPHAAHLIPPSCLPNHSQRVLHCMCVLRTSGMLTLVCFFVHVQMETQICGNSRYAPPPLPHALLSFACFTLRSDMLTLTCQVRVCGRAH